MFEKEAEEYEGRKHYRYEDNDYCGDIADGIIQAFQQGAELGYNKAKGELEEKYKETICNLEMNLNSVTERLEELNKANEWHLVKDELPPLNTNILVIHKWHRTPEVGKRITVFPNCSKWVWAMCCDRYRYTSDDQNVIAWKEIVLPKENE